MGGNVLPRLAAVVASLGAVALVAVLVLQPDREATWLRADPSAAAAVAAPLTPAAAAPVTTTTLAAAPPPVVAAAPAPRPRPAQAPRPVAVERTPDSVGKAALALITYPWQERLNVSIVFAGPRPGYRAISTAQDGRDQVIVYVGPKDTARLVAVNIAHELGHLIDYRHRTDSDRAQWLAERGRADAVWWACDYCPDYATGSGDFAETFAAWQVGPIDYRSQLAALPTPQQMQSLARFFT